MKRVFLGDSGLMVSELAMGTQTFGWGVEQLDAGALADHFVEQGGLLFDTSSTYNGGASELMLGCWMKSRRCRHSVVIASKVFFATGEAPTTPACRETTFCAQPRKACVACKPTTSTCTRRTATTCRLRSKRHFAPSTTWCAPER